MLKKLNEAVMTTIPEGGEIMKMEASDGGNYIFVGMRKAICIYNTFKE